MGLCHCVVTCGVVAVTGEELGLTRRLLVPFEPLGVPFVDEVDPIAERFLVEVTTSHLDLAHVVSFPPTAVFRTPSLDASHLKEGMTEEYSRQERTVADSAM